LFLPVKRDNFVLKTGVPGLQEPERGGEEMPKIKIIGIGGAGCNSLSRLVVSGITDVDCIAMNFDHQNLDRNKVPEKIYLETTWRGFDSPGKEYRKNDVLTQKPKILQAIGSADAVIVMAGLGGATGSGGTPAVIEIAKEQKILTATVVSTPFTFEGNHRKKEAVEAVKTISERADIMVVISGDSILRIADQKCGVERAFHLLDEKMGQTVQDIVGYFSSRLLPGK
jgi:cell division protein FtsZ